MTSVNDASIAAIQQSAADLLAETSLHYAQAALICAALEAAVVRLRAGQQGDIAIEDVIEDRSVGRRLDKLHAMLGDVVRQHLKVSRAGAKVRAAAIKEGRFPWL